MSADLAMLRNISMSFGNTVNIWSIAIIKNNTLTLRLALTVWQLDHGFLGLSLSITEIECQAQSRQALWTVFYFICLNGYYCNMARTICLTPFIDYRTLFQFSRSWTSSNCRPWDNITNVNMKPHMLYISAVQINQLCKIITCKNIYSLVLNNTMGLKVSNILTLYYYPFTQWNRYSSSQFTFSCLIRNKQQSLQASKCKSWKIWQIVRVPFQSRLCNSIVVWGLSCGLQIFPWCCRLYLWVWYYWHCSCYMLPRDALYWSDAQYIRF